MSIAGCIWTGSIVLGLVAWVWAAWARKAKFAAFLGLVAIAGWVWTGTVPMPTGLAEFVQFLATTAALAPVSSVVLQVIRLYIPELADKAALAASAAAAFFACILANFAVPYIPVIPPMAEHLWPFLVWFLQQIWYIYGGEKMGVYRMA